MKKIGLCLVLMFVLSACSTEKVNQLEKQVSQHVNTISMNEKEIAALESKIQDLEHKQDHVGGRLVANLHQTFNIGKQTERDDELSAMLIQMFQGPLLIAYASDAMYEEIIAFQSDATNEGKIMSFEIADDTIIGYGLLP